MKPAQTQHRHTTQKRTQVRKWVRIVATTLAAMVGTLSALATSSPAEATYCEPWDSSCNPDPGGGFTPIGFFYPELNALCPTGPDLKCVYMSTLQSYPVTLTVSGGGSRQWQFPPGTEVVSGCGASDNECTLNLMSPDCRLLDNCPGCFFATTTVGVVVNTLIFGQVILSKDVSTPASDCVI
jgi:hypothetical protein